MTQTDGSRRSFGDPARSAMIGFAPDHFAYDMIRLAFLPWTIMEEATRQAAAAFAPAESLR